MFGTFDGSMQYRKIITVFAGSVPTWGEKKKKLIV
jgi:hypothetical protein